MFKKNKTVLALAVIILTLLSCAHCQQYTNVKNMLPRESFMHLYKTLKVKSCNEGHCISLDFKSSASGFVVSKQKDGAFILTAAHFCEDSLPSYRKEDIIVSSTYKVKSLYGNEYGGIVLDYKQDIDICLMFVEGVTTDVKEIELASEPPEPGDKIYNVGAPLSIFGPNMVPILEGRFNGNIEKKAFYSLPAAPGSSGSMIINDKGDLVGMVQAVYIRFNTISISITYEDLKNYIDVKVNKYISYKNSMKELGLKNIFTLEKKKNCNCD